ncbi:MAG TPA: methyltransferase domain-containing protein [Solirubrobacteraceae bacterium]|nr:methyltransferase domain-containing protein [Solirubrobacteraceae bacterium]
MSGERSLSGQRLEDVARELVAACGLGPGMRALDVGARTGDLAFAIAASGASPEACEAVPALVEEGRARCEALGEWEIPWVVADAERLPLAGGRFDAVLSVFGLVAGPRADVAVAEAFRVARSGGCVGFTTWTPGSAGARLNELVGSRLPRPAGAAGSPASWGEEATCRARLRAYAVDVAFELDSVLWTWPSVAAAREEIERSSPSLAAARAALSPERHAALLDDLDDLVRALNTATDGSVACEAQYARVVARKPG